MIVQACEPALSIRNWVCWGPRESGHLRNMLRCLQKVTRNARAEPTRRSSGLRRKRLLRAPSLGHQMGPCAVCSVQCAVCSVQCVLYHDSPPHSIIPSTQIRWVTLHPEDPQDLTNSSVCWWDTVGAWYSSSQEPRGCINYDCLLLLHQPWRTGRGSSLSAMWPAVGCRASARPPELKAVRSS